MNIQVRRVEFNEVEGLRGLYREETNCRILYDSILPRGMADPYLILVDGRVGGYGGAWNTTDSKGRVMEFYTLPGVRAAALPMFRELLAVSGATGIEAQTDIPLLTLMLFDCARNVTSETLLFEDAVTTHLTCPDGVLRRNGPEDAPHISLQAREPVGDWRIEVGGTAVATGGALFHYNPPFGDVYMEVAEPHRRRGYGSYLVQEIKRICYETGKKPVSRCNISNVASRRTLQKAGFLPCARLMVGEIAARD
ncbi:MAG: GNAT family N-acetyltransferase [Armatimonadetes bacterium]|nr:GNAT family N-acetyltransferase [Armatimonadota bacterium]